MSSVSDLPSGFDKVARTLVRVFGDVVLEEKRPVWVQLLDRDEDDFQLAVAPEEFPVLGWRAPPECFAVGTVASGRVVALDGGRDLPAQFASGLEGGARIGCVVARSGPVSWYMSLPDGSEVLHPPEDGRMLDVLHRCLELPTPAPSHPIGRLHAIAWIGAIIERATAAQYRLRWSEALDAHPAVASRTGRHKQPPAAGPNATPAAGPNATPEDLIRMASQAESWESMRLLVAAGHGAWGMPEPELADWMDEGMFARWVLSELPPLETLIGEARHFLEPAAARRVAHLAREVA